MADISIFSPNIISPLCLLNQKKILFKHIKLWPNKYFFLPFPTKYLPLKSKKLIQETPNKLPKKINQKSPQKSLQKLPPKIAPKDHRWCIQDPWFIKGLQGKSHTFESCNCWFQKAWLTLQAGSELDYCAPIPRNACILFYICVTWKLR